MFANFIIIPFFLYGFSSASAQFNNQEQHNQPALYELIVGPHPQNPQNIITVITADHKSKQLKTFSELANLLSTLHSRIAYVAFTGVGFNYDMIKLLTSVDSILWTGNIRLLNCDFTQLQKNEILDIFKHVLRTESLQLVQNPGLTSEILNQALKERIFTSSLAVIGDESDGLRLNPDALIAFLHEPAFLTINPAFIDGGISKFVGFILERFKSDTEPVTFHLQLTRNVILPLLADAPFKNAATGEYLSIGELEVTSGSEVIKKTIIRRSMDEKSDNYSSHHEL